MKSYSGFQHVFLAFIIFELTPHILSITTIHHDKPPEAKLSVMASKMKEEELLQLNVTLPPSERHKRLLPYMNFYSKQTFNQPNRQHASPQRYVLVAPKQSTFQPFHHKFNELTGTNYQPKLLESQQVLYQPNVKFTPFLESNALPGPFTPMRNSQGVNYTPLQQYEISKLPNYSAIYDKLSQLKLIQQSGQAATSYNQKPRYNEPQYIYNYVRRPLINYIPIQDYHQQQDPQKLKQTEPTNTIVQTYTATHIDIPTTEAQYGQNYEQIPATVTSYNKQSTKTAHIQEPALQKQVHPDLVTIQNHEQYVQDQKHYISKPVIIINTKPIRLQHEKLNNEQKIFENQLKIYEDQQKLYENQQKKYGDIIITDSKDNAQKPLVYGQKLVPQTPQKYVIPNTENYNIQVPKYETISVQKLQPVQKIIIQQLDPISEYDSVQTLRPVQKFITIPKLEMIPKAPVQKYQTIQNTEDDKYEAIQNVEPVQKYFGTADKYEQDHITAPVPKYETIQNIEPLPKFQTEAREHITEVRPTAQAYQVPVTEYHTANLPTENSNSLSHILKHLQDTNTLPQTLTPDNIDNSIKTLVRILDVLKNQQMLSKKPIIVAEEVGTSYEHDFDNEAGVGLGGVDGGHGDTPGTVTQNFPADTHEGGTPGKPGVDYPALSTIPQTSFSCKTQRYKGFFGDPDTNCQVWHYCDFNGGQASFLCPNGTIFSQVALTCDWWYNVKCSSTPQLYVLNERLYKYILPYSPKFPEDYTGPLVDRYLALKFEEMEEKMKKQRKKSKGSKEDEEKKEPEQDDADELNYENRKNSKEYTTLPQEEQDLDIK